MGAGDDNNDGISFGRSQPCQHTTSIRKRPTQPVAEPPAPHTQPQPTPCELCISAVGGKHYTGFAQGGGSLKISSWPLAVTLLDDRGEQLYIHHKQALKERGGEREGELLLYSGRGTKPKKKKLISKTTKKCVKTCWCFIV